jgi:hypothetical protein
MGDANDRELHGVEETSDQPAQRKKNSSDSGGKAWHDFPSSETDQFLHSSHYQDYLSISDSIHRNHCVFHRFSFGSESLHRFNLGVRY